MLKRTPSRNERCYAYDARHNDGVHHNSGAYHRNSSHHNSGAGIEAGGSERSESCVDSCMGGDAAASSAAD